MPFTQTQFNVVADYYVDKFLLNPATAKRKLRDNGYDADHPGVRLAEAGQILGTTVSPELQQAFRDNILAALTNLQQQRESQTYPGDMRATQITLSNMDLLDAFEAIPQEHLQSLDAAQRLSMKVSMHYAESAELYDDGRLEIFNEPYPYKDQPEHAPIRTAADLTVPHTQLTRMTPFYRVAEEFFAIPVEEGTDCTLMSRQGPHLQTAWANCMLVAPVHSNSYHVIENVTADDLKSPEGKLAHTYLTARDRLLRTDDEQTAIQQGENRWMTVRTEPLYFVECDRDFIVNDKHFLPGDVLILSAKGEWHGSYRKGFVPPDAYLRKSQEGDYSFARPDLKMPKLSEVCPAFREKGI